MPTVKLGQTVIVLLVTLMIASGCNDEDARVVQMTQEAAQRQAEQNQEMAHLNREVAEGTKRLVEGQADADQHWQAMEQNIHGQQDHLEAERRQQAGARQRDSLLAPKHKPEQIIQKLREAVAMLSAEQHDWPGLPGAGGQRADAGPLAESVRRDEVGGSQAAEGVG